MLAIDEEAQQYELEEVVQPAGILGDEGYVLSFFYFSSDNLRGAFDDGIFLELVFLFMNFFSNAALDFPHFFRKGLLNSGALFAGSFNFALRAFDPADGRGEID